MAEADGSWCLMLSDPAIFTELVNKFGESELGNIFSHIRVLSKASKLGDINRTLNLHYLV